MFTVGLLPQSWFRSFYCHICGVNDMVKDDRRIATFHSPFKGGDVELWYCAHRSVYELRYDVRFYTLDGLTDAVALTSYDACDYDQVVDIIVDATDLALTPFLGRD